MNQTIISTAVGNKHTIYAIREERGLFTVYKLRDRNDQGRPLRSFPTRIEAEMYIDHSAP